jgi:hypothetical protein
MGLFGRLAQVISIIISTCWLWSCPAKADCGFDPICAISTSIGRGAGGGFADSVRPLVTDVMEREAPALIAQLRAGVDHNIMTAEQAGEKLVDYATSLLNKAADDILNKVQDRSQSLIDYASVQTLIVEQQVFNDVNKIIDRFNCSALGVNALLERQQKILDDDVNIWIRTIKFWSHPPKEMVEQQCQQKLGINPALKTADMEIPTTFKLWRCVRLALTEPNGQATAIRDAYNDAVVMGKANMCALQSGTDVSLREITETWIDDSQSAKAWDRAIRGE